MGIVQSLNLVGHAVIATLGLCLLRCLFYWHIIVIDVSWNGFCSFESGLDPAELDYVSSTEGAVFALL